MPCILAVLFNLFSLRISLYSTVSNRDPLLTEEDLGLEEESSDDLDLVVSLNEDDLGLDSGSVSSHRIDILALFLIPLAFSLEYIYIYQKSIQPEALFALSPERMTHICACGLPHLFRKKEGIATNGQPTSEKPFHLFISSKHWDSRRYVY